MGYFSDINDGPQTTLRAFIRVIHEYYNVIIIGFTKNEDSDFFILEKGNLESLF